MTAPPAGVPQDEALVALVESHRRCGHDGGRQSRYTWTCGMVSEAYGRVGWEASHMAAALEASGWLADLLRGARAEALREAADEVPQGGLGSRRTTADWLRARADHPAPDHRARAGLGEGES